MARKIKAGSILKGAAIVGAVSGGTAMASSHTASQLMSAMDWYAEAYGDGNTLKGFAMRMVPGTVLTGVGVLATSGKPGIASLVGALGLGGTLIGALAPVASDKIGNAIADAIRGGSIFGGEGGPVTGVSVGGPTNTRTLQQKVDAMHRLVASGAIGGSGGVVQGVSVGGANPNARIITY